MYDFSLTFQGLCVLDETSFSCVGGKNGGPVWEILYWFTSKRLQIKHLNNAFKNSEMTRVYWRSKSLGWV